MIKTALFRFSFPSCSDATIISSVLSPELQQSIPKTKVTITQSDKTLILRIESKDVSSLRAACNSYLRWIQTALSVKQLV